MKELSGEERERLKSVMHLDDAGLDEWLAQQAQTDVLPAASVAISDDEAQVVERQKELMRACWQAADEVVKLPEGNPQFGVEAIWRITADIAIQIHAEVAREIREKMRKAASP